MSEFFKEVNFPIIKITEKSICGQSSEKSRKLKDLRGLAKGRVEN